MASAAPDLPSDAAGALPPKQQDLESIRIKRRDTIRRLGECFSAATGNVGEGGGDSSHRPGYMVAANYLLLAKDEFGAFLVKVGWGDFVASADRPQDLGPKRIEGIGPVFVLPQFDAYLDENKWRELEQDPEKRIFERADYLVSGNSTYANTHGQERTPIAPTVQNSNFEDAAFQAGITALEPDEYIRLMRTKAVKQYIGKEDFDMFMGALPTELKAAQRFCAETYRYYSEDFLPFLSEDNQRWHGSSREDTERQKQVHRQFVERYRQLRPHLTHSRHSERSEESSQSVLGCG